MFDQHKKQWRLEWFEENKTGPMAYANILKMLRTSKMQIKFLKWKKPHIHIYTHQYLGKKIQMINESNTNNTHLPFFDLFCLRLNESKQQKKQQQH